MATSPHPHSIIHARFFKPLLTLLEDSAHRRSCPALPDPLWLEMGVRRCLGLFQSGRDFLQHLADCLGVDVELNTFFESLKSVRRLRLLTGMNDRIAAWVRRARPDPFAAFPCLQEFDLWAGDGHFIAAACHDPARGGVKYATGHLYSLNLRSHAMNHLCVNDQVARKKEHDMRALKRQDILSLRHGAAVGRKVLYVWDKAGIDFLQWHLWKQRAGIYFLSREKDNMKLETLGVFPFDKSDPVNHGVLSDEIVSTSAGVSVRRVVFRDSETGVIYRFLTNLPASISPGLIALLYKARWDIEKVFDEFKNKLCETKAWGSTPVAKCCQARLLCLTHNLMLLMEGLIEAQSPVRNQSELRRKAKRLTERHEQSQQSGAGGLSFVHTCVQRFTQRSVKFVRWLKNHLDSKRSWSEALARLDQIYGRS